MVKVKKNLPLISNTKKEYKIFKLNKIILSYFD